MNSAPDLHTLIARIRWTVSGYVRQLAACGYPAVPLPPSLSSPVMSAACMEEKQKWQLDCLSIKTDHVLCTVALSCD